MGSSHPAEANTVLAEAIHEKTFAKLETKFRRRTVAITMGAVFTCWRRICVGT